MNNVLLNNIDHKDLRVITTRSAAYGDDVKSALTFPAEFRNVQACYPIVFHKAADGKFQSIAQANIDLLLRAQAAGMWGALPMMERVRPGRYALQARAWRTKASGGDWTGAFAPNDVQIK